MCPTAPRVEPTSTASTPPAFYRPRHPERAPTYRLLERDCAAYVRANEERFAERLRQQIVAPVAHRHVVFTIPRVLRGLFERERALLGLLARAAYETLRRVLAAAGAVDGASHAVPGVVASIQTFGSFANFHPHIHALVAEGVFAPDGTFHAVEWPPSSVLEETFRGLLLAELRRAERLSQEFFESLLAWRHSGFSVHGEQQLEAEEGAGLKRLARYVARPALAVGAVKLRPDGRVELATPPDPRTGASELVLDPLDFVHAVVTQIPDARKHLVRYYGAYSHRFRGRVRAARPPGTVPPETAPSPSEPTPAAPLPGAVPLAVRAPTVAAEPGSPQARRRAAWARLLAKVFEVDPLLCPRCQTEMKVLALITEPAVIDRILAHRRQAGLESPSTRAGPQRPAGVA